jgi:hypothetical protein
MVQDSEWSAVIPTSLSVVWLMEGLKKREHGRCLGVEFDSNFQRLANFADDGVGCFRYIDFEGGGRPL